MQKVMALQLNCYLYSLWTGRLKEYKGDIYESMRNDNLANFKTETHRYLCSMQPGVVYNGSVWFAEQNIEKAKKCLIEYEEINILEFQEKIKNCLHRIKVLKE